MVKVEHAVVLAIALLGLGGLSDLGLGMGRAVAADGAGAPRAFVTSRQAARIPVELLGEGLAEAASRVAVIGDVHGQSKALAKILRGLGADVDSGRLPEGLTVIQVGDLVHKGPDTPGVLDIVERFLRNEPTRWVQLMGNHEARYLGGPGFVPFNGNIDEGSVARLMRWYDEGNLRVAAAIAREDLPEGILVTHAGLTAGMWRDIGAPATAKEAARRLNRLVHTDPEFLFRSGRGLAGEATSTRAGPVWADATDELIRSWMDEEAPFSQARGHSNAYRYDRGKWLLPDEFHGPHVVDAKTKHEFVEAGGRWLVGTDPKNAKEATHGWKALEFTGGAKVVTGKVSAQSVGVVHEHRPIDEMLAEFREMAEHIHHK